MTAHFRKIAVKDIRRETDDCVSVSFDIPPELREPFRFIQGQSLTIRANIQHSEVRRSYSLSSSPLENEWRIAVKKVKGGVFSTFANEHLKPGDCLEMLPPVGTFYISLDPLQQRNYVCLAAGSGITPVLSNIKTILRTEPHSRITLIYANRNSQSIIFKEELEALKNRYLDRLSLHFLLTREKSDAPLHHGRIDREKCAMIFDKIASLESDAFFICGPAEMIFCIRDFLKEHGVEESRIHFELFTPLTGPVADSGISRSAEVPSATPQSRITLIHDGISSDFELGHEKESILDAALHQGIDLPYSCKGGVCCTCRARLVTGEVTMDANYALDTWELAKGFILACQSHPITERVVIDFDTK